MSNKVFTSESVSPGHPDKVADQIADAVLDHCLMEDPQSRVACEVLVSSSLVVLAGEITTKARPDFQHIARETIAKIGYIDPDLGFDALSCGVISSINEQSLDIACGVNPGEGLDREMGAGDQGIMYGYACDETPELMPLPISLANKIQARLIDLRHSHTLPYLRPDGKCQVTVRYDHNQRPFHVESIVLSAQHAEEVTRDKLVNDIEMMIHEIIPPELIDSSTQFYINPTGRFILGGPAADCGITGRKLMVDTYGSVVRHGGGSFSGKDPTKVDRSGAYAARYVAKHIVAAEWATRCEVQLAYAIGVSKPIALYIDTFGTGKYDDEIIIQAVARVFDLSPAGIIGMLDLQRPIYFETAALGHFGRNNPNFTWEKLDRVEELSHQIAMA